MCLNIKPKTTLQIGLWIFANEFTESLTLLLVKWTNIS
jgi:hypothetical protein